MDGTITGINPGSNSGTLTISCSGENSGSVVAGSYSASQFSDLSVMIYQRKVVENNTDYYYRVGIWMNCYDIENKKLASIRLYGGTSENPNVMIGNLDQATLDTVGDIPPTGWSLYAQNAFLQGAVVSNEGQIGGFTIGDSTLSNGTFAQSGGVFMSTGKTASNAIGGSSGSNTWAFTAGNTFGVTTAGKLYATSGNIAGWRIEPTYFASGTATAPAANVLLLSPAGTTSSYTVAGTAKSGWMITAGTTFGVNKDGGVYATSGKIGGWTIGVSSLYNVTDSLTSTSAGIYLGTDGIYNYKDSNTYVKVTNGVITAKAVDLTGKITATSGAIGGFDITATAIKTKDVAVTSNADNSISLSSADFTRTINSTSRAGLRFAIGDKFGVTGDGIIYASSVDLTGKITATSGTIGGCSITDGTLAVPAANITGTLSADHIDASSLQIGQTQVTGLSTALDNKADNSTVTALSNKVAAVYGTSNPGSTNASEQVKVVTCSNFELFSGALITVKFTYANAYASGAVQLNVNSKGAKNIWVANAVTSSTNKLLWGAGAVITFRYDGSAFIVVGEPREWYGTCSTAAGTSGKVSTDVAGCVICKGAVVSLSMTNDNTATSPSLNIVYTGSINLYAGNGTTRPTTANGLGWTAGSTVPFVFDGQYWRVGDTASLSRASDAAKTATNYISTIGNTGIKVSYATNSTNYLQITADGTSIYKNSVQVANYGDSIILGKLAADTTHVEIDSDSFDVCLGATTGANSTKLATFGETSVIGNMSARGVSINSDGFKFNSGGKTAFYIGIDNRSGSTASEVTGYTFPSNPEIKYINSIPYYLLTTISSDKTVIEVGVYAEMADPEAESRIFYDWIVDDNKLYINCDEVDQKYDAAVDFVSYIYTTNTNTQTPYYMIGDNAYSSSNPAGTMSFAQGCKCLALGAYSTSVGWETLASGTSSFSLGKRSEAQGAYSFAGGALSTSKDFVSFAYGYKSNAWGKYSIAFGNQDLDTWIFEILITSCDTEQGDITCRITQNAEIFEDYISANSILVSTDNQYIFEDLVVTSGSGTSDITFSCSLYGGHFPAVNSVLHVRVNPPGSYGNGAMSVNACCASGISSTALGIGTTAYTGGSLAIGMYNIPESNVLFSIGNGTMLENHNAMTVDMFGNVKATKFQGEQKILWQGKNYMSDSQNANLSELVSAQANGIVLVWSGYTPSTSTAQNYQWHFDFIPKWLVAVHPGAGVTCIMAGATFNPVAAKYVYIDNDKIRGFANNASTSGTSHGISWNNTSFVLRYVIGV